MTIKVCLPYYLHYQDAEPGIQELIHCKEQEFNIVTGQGYDPAQARNLMVSENQQEKQTEFGEFSHFLFVDSDIIFNVAHALALLEHDKDIISAAYIRRDRPKFFNAGLWDEEVPGNISKHFQADSTGLNKCDYVGAGFLLVKAEAFSKIAFPWFRRYVIGDDKGRRMEISEDYGFCMGAREAGLDVWVDCDTVVEHNIKPPQLPQGSVAAEPEDWIPASMADEILEIQATLSRFNKKYNLLYQQVLRSKNAG
jgi:hypothetical protein